MALQQHSNTIATIGECMLEYYSSTSLPPHTPPIAFGGDTLNVAVYLARQQVPVDFVTCIGDDTFSQWAYQQWQQHNIGLPHTYQLANQTIGAYSIAPMQDTRSQLTYWRDHSAARKLLTPSAQTHQLLRALYDYQYLFISGISLAIISNAARQQLFAFLQAYRESGGNVIFDSNYRPSLWHSIEQAQATCRQMYSLSDIALSSLDGEQALFGETNAAAVIKRLQHFGLKEIALKMAGNGCKIVSPNTVCTVPCRPVEQVIDTTAAGDAFNAGYIAARLAQKTTIEAAEQGHRMAAPTLKHLGAITPR